MKKLAFLALAGLVVLGSVGSFAGPPDLNNQTDCNSNHQKCREYVFNLDEPWLKVAIMLTGCDIAFGKCMLSL